MTRHAALLAASLLFAAPALAQDYSPEDVPDQVPAEEVAKRVDRILAQAPEETVEIDGVAKLTYRRIPTDVAALSEAFVKTLSSNEVPRGIDAKIYVRQYEPQLARLLEERLLEAGTFEALCPLEIQRKKLPVGEFTLGVAFKRERPAAIVLSGEDLPKGKPIAIKVKLKRAEEDDGKLLLALVEPEEQEEGEFEFSLHATLRGAVALAKKPFERSEASEK